MTGPVGGEHAAALRAFLTGDDTAFDLIGGLLDEDGSWSPMACCRPPLSPWPPGDVFPTDSKMRT